MMFDVDENANVSVNRALCVLLVILPTLITRKFQTDNQM